MEREYGFPEAATSSMGLDEAFLRGYFSDLISLQPLLQSAPLPSLNYYLPHDGAVSAPPPYDGGVLGSQSQYSHAPPMSYHTPYDGGDSASQFQYAPSMNYSSPFDGGDSSLQFQYAPPMNYQSPLDGGLSVSQFQYVPPMSYHSPYDGGVFASLFQLPAFPPETPLRTPKNESFDSREFAFQLLNLNAGGGVIPEPLINFFPNSDNESAGNREVMREYQPYSKRRSESRKVRQKSITEKTQRLKRLLPSDRKMDTGTMLEEAYKYVKFLEAQVKILKAMPVESGHRNPSSGDGGSRTREEELRKLDRQQLLQVVLNSRAAQAMMSSRGFCVYSGEQLTHMLRDLADKKAFWEHMMRASITL